MTIKSVSSFFLCALALVMFSAIGCDKPDDGHDGTDATGAHDHDDDHDHGHEEEDRADADDHPAHGPNGGHIVTLDTKEYQAEWKKYKDNNVIKMYVLDAEGKKAAPIKADSFIVTSKVGEEGANFELSAEDPDENGLSAVYMLDDEELAMAIPLGVDIEIKVGDKTMKGEIKAHKPLDH